MDETQKYVFTLYSKFETTQSKRVYKANKNLLQCQNVVGHWMKGGGNFLGSNKKS